MTLARRLREVLEGRGDNYVLPFFWQHGEDEQTLRHYMRVINESGCGAVCVESRPHPDFCGPKWWEDMDVILDEARTLGMKVWILDDDHFPTGHANGAMAKAPESLCRQSIYCKPYDVDQGSATFHLSSEDIDTIMEYPKSVFQLGFEKFMKPQHRRFEDDRLLGLIALRLDVPDEWIDLSGMITPEGLCWTVPEGRWKIYQLGLSRNYGPHRDYINMMDRDSCRILIDAVYEPHHARYADLFGSVIAGFFSDEPELGNGALYPMGNSLGTAQDLPWSQELEVELQERLGEGWLRLLPMLWETGDDATTTARVRYQYMDSVTRLVERNFSMQIGDWCQERGVQYVGHVVEDGNQDTRTASSLGHFFRGLAGQQLAGIDNIGGQVLPQGEDEPSKDKYGRERDGEFFHYMLGKLASSHAAIDARKQGRALCENFGNYGWAGGVQLMKYLADHFMVRGINHFTPHAFSPKAYPDPDCPPHFYAHGHNPQYRHFGCLVRYMNRVCHLISGGTIETPVAMLYHAEAEWSGGERMFGSQPARRLLDAQIDFTVLPSDVFAETVRYRTELQAGLSVNGHRYRALLLPATDYVTRAVAKAVEALHKQGFPVLLLGKRPTALLDDTAALPEVFSDCRVVSLEELVPTLKALEVPELQLRPANHRLRVLRYRHEGELYLIVNEGTSRYDGLLSVPSQGQCAMYAPWENKLYPADVTALPAGSELSVSVEPGHSLMFVFSDLEGMTLESKRIFSSSSRQELTDFYLSLCTAKEYPHFSDEQAVSLPDDLAARYPAFSGFVRYETSFELVEASPLSLVISKASEGVEVFVNGISAGIQIAAPFHFDLTGLVCAGRNELTIEVATSLERERAAAPVGRWESMLGAEEPTSSSGITGSVYLQCHEAVCAR